MALKCQRDRSNSGWGDRAFREKPNTLSQEDETMATPGGSWQEWVMVVGYVSFAAFIIWRVLMSK